MLPLSVLDLSPITEGSDAGQSLRNSADLARHAERLGYKRFWMAEHHSMPGIASAGSAALPEPTRQRLMRCAATSRRTPTGSPTMSSS